jgi:hypothetical protein|tara:strand:+ start:179 stop:1036 length:858 start_codon:yes stop_codon:yes gene_type:complete
MKIRHSKFKNTGLIFELLVKQIAADTLSNKESKAIAILKKHFTGKTALVREFKLYEFILKNKGIGQQKAETILSTITEISRNLDQKLLKKQKYDLISDIKESYNSEEFFGIQTNDYKALASLYCLLEAQNNDITSIDPNSLVSYKSTLLEHLTTAVQDPLDVKDTLIEEYSKYDKDLKMLTFKIMLEKFNDNYKDLLPEQKNILKEFITSVNSQTRLRNVINEELLKIATAVGKLSTKVKDEVIKIKLDEVSKSIKALKKTDKITDNHLVNLMQYYDLVNELKSL